MNFKCSDIRQERAHFSVSNFFSGENFFLIFSHFFRDIPSGFCSKVSRRVEANLWNFQLSQTSCQ